MNYYYHLTQPEFVSTIQKEGLKPMLGKRSKSIGDKEERLCLCSESSIDAWSIMLGTNTVIKVVVPDEDKMELIDQGNVSDEYNYDGVIPPEYIVDIFTVNPSKIILNKLRYNYMWGLSEFCTYCARYYTELDSENTDEEYLDALKEAIQVTGELLVPVIPKLCYPDMPKEERKVDCQHFFRQIFLGYFSDIVQAFDTLRKNVCGDDYTSLHNPIVLSSVLPAYGMFHSIQILFL